MDRGTNSFPVRQGWEVTSSPVMVCRVMKLLDCVRTTRQSRNWKGPRLAASTTLTFFDPADRGRLRTRPSPLTPAQGARLRGARHHPAHSHDELHLNRDLTTGWRRIRSDLKRRRFIDAYSAAFVAFTLAVLSLVGDIVPDQLRWAALLTGVGILVRRVTIPDSGVTAAVYGSCATEHGRGRLYGWLSQ